MPKSHSILQLLSRHRVVSIVAGQVVILAALALMVLGNGLSLNVSGAFASASCASSDTSYSVRLGDTLGNIAKDHQTTVQNLTSYNHLSSADLIFVDQTICIPAKAGFAAPATSNQSPVKATSTVQTPVIPAVPVAMKVSNAILGAGNYFPYGQCTWWANERYHQLHGVYVPWTTNSNAYQWTARAHDFHWNVSSTPRVGAIMQLSPGSQGAFGVGHVAVVEQVLAGGKVNVSQMNWNGGLGIVSHSVFATGAGVAFITHN
ncbi:CHAP domain-containing protein [Dictyobacter arantiisoli]|uniref:Peptidase C51 domain-containing protein n=1 Tax=Dictyobacter arantiisoli TaxID=2014874 RepID=A0A5A5TGM4_9CHLR|nr:CHAP domain-containing protein [Dictyobacter arantiisoli]GCF10731.1 hypothetical protein KDI_42950 [Dictyobacter arantiisoli]